MSVSFDPKLERMAKDGTEMPDGLDYPNQIMYLCLRMLYSQLRLSIIDRDAAIREKSVLCVSMSAMCSSTKWVKSG